MVPESAASDATSSGDPSSGALRFLRVLIDTNVVLDWLLDRRPWSDAAKPLWDARDAGRIVMYLPASVLTDIFYIMQRQAGISAAFTAIDRVFAAFGLFPAT